VKKCAYCGRENADDAADCGECGTAFSTPAVDTPSGKRRDWTWLEWLGWCLRYLAFALAIGFIYLLSLGPVERYFFKMTSTTTTITTRRINGQTVVLHATRITYPHWIGVVYRPAFLLRSNAGGESLYARYLEWWTAGRK